MKVDIHSHDLKQVDYIKIVSYSLHELPQAPLGSFCVGIHPWHIDQLDNPTKKIQELEECIKTHSPCLLGEMGLDNAIELEMKLQMKYLQLQLELAVKYNYKVILIHCVKSFNDIISCIKKSKYKGAIIFHDYNGSLLETEQLLKLNSYFSFSKSLFNNKMKGHQSLKFLPFNKLFLETDDQNNYNIFEAYELMAKVKGISLANLEDQLYLNYKDCFL